MKRQRQNKTKKWQKKRLTWYLLVVLLGMSLAFFYKDILKKIPYFRVTSVRIEGDNNIDEQHILSILNLKGGVNIFDIDIEKLSDKLILAEPWIKSVSFARVLPSELIIKIESKEVVAIAKIDNSLFYVDKDGIPVDKVKSFYNNDFLIISNKDGSEFKDIVRFGEDIENYINEENLHNMKLSELVKDKDGIYRLILEGTKVSVYISDEHVFTKLKYINLIFDDLKRRNEKVKVIYAILPSMRFVVKE